MVYVVDAQGAAVEDAKVTYSLDGAPFAPATCTAPYGAVTGCKAWVPAWERSGVFVVHAESADGAHTDEDTVNVMPRECHVETKTVTLTL